MDFVKFWLRLRPAIASLFFACVPIAALPQDEPGGGSTAPAGLIERYVAEVEDLTARFDQKVYEADGALVASETSFGELALLRPDRFRLRYESPYEEIVVADGEWIWQYDVEVDQVTCAPLSDLSTSPAMLLSGDGTVAEGFDVSDVESDDGRRWVELKPRDDDSEFVSARIAFRDGIPDALQLLDEIARTTVVELSDVVVNSGLRRRDFEFDRPRGVDVIGECE
jgi:outer membrane lipoprotein carrier protein